MEIASHNYHHKQDRYQSNISLLVMQLDGGVNETLAVLLAAIALRRRSRTSQIGGGLRGCTTTPVITSQLY